MLVDVIRISVSLLSAVHLGQQLVFNSGVMVTLASMVLNISTPQANTPAPTLTTVTTLLASLLPTMNPLSSNPTTSLQTAKTSNTTTEFSPSTGVLVLPTATTELSSSNNSKVSTATILIAVFSAIILTVVLVVIFILLGYYCYNRAKKGRRG